MTLRLDPNDPRKFHCGNLSQIESAFVRTWEYAPTPERIVQDILRVREALKVVKEAEGSYVDFNGCRSGGREHLQRLAQAEEEDEVRPKKRYRAAGDLNDMAIHPDAREATVERLDSREGVAAVQI